MEVMSRQELHGQLQDQVTAFLLNSKRLFGEAYKQYVECGLGAFCMRLAGPELLCRDGTNCVLQYMDLMSLSRLPYAYPMKLVREYTPENSFVLVIGVTMGVAGGEVFTACMAHRDVEDKLKQGLVAPSRAVVKHRVGMCSRIACGTTSAHLQTCSRCRSVSYCSKECQYEDWRNGHKSRCSQNKD